MDDSILKYFIQKEYQVVKKGRIGKHEPDWDIINSDGVIFPVEDKSLNEITGQTSSWWSSWQQRLKSRYKHDINKKLSSHERGWIAVIDGQLRDWCDIANVPSGFLVAEYSSKDYGKSNKCIADEIKTSLNFLVKNDCIYSWEEDFLEKDKFDCIFINVAF